MITNFVHDQLLNSMRPGDARWCPSRVSSLVKLMVCRLISAKPLLESKLNHCQLGLGNKLLWNLNPITCMNICIKRYILKCCLQRGSLFNMSNTQYENEVWTNWTVTHVIPHTFHPYLISTDVTAMNSTSYKEITCAQNQGKFHPWNTYCGIQIYLSISWRCIFKFNMIKLKIIVVSTIVLYYQSNFAILECWIVLKENKVYLDDIPFLDIGTTQVSVLKFTLKEDKNSHTPYKINSSPDV